MKDEAALQSTKRAPSIDQIYGDLVDDYKYHLGWRERLLVGFIAVSGALVFGFDKLQASLIWAVPLAGFAVSIAIFYLEERCHDILLDRRRAGIALEKAAGVEGFFTRAQKMGRARRPSHTDVLRLLYLLGALSFAVWAMGTVADCFSSPWAARAAFGVLMAGLIGPAVWHVWQGEQKYRTSQDASVVR